MSTTEFTPTDLTTVAQSLLDRARTTQRTFEQPATVRRQLVGQDPVPDWRDAAACIDHDLNLFFPISSIGAAAQRQIVEAKRVCASCPVQQSCLSWALAVGPEFGIFGGRTEEERRLLRQPTGTRNGRVRSVPGLHCSEESVTEALEPR